MDLETFLQNKIQRNDVFDNINFHLKCGQLSDQRVITTMKYDFPIFSADYGQNEQNIVAKHEFYIFSIF